ncbi:hypothetical protein HDU83_003146 [Entophlyctis luteolus]|nr:hypothetical protein HDU83_003146 [Entophlyctis luteolus]
MPLNPRRDLSGSCKLHSNTYPDAEADEECHEGAELWTKVNGVFVRRVVAPTNLTRSHADARPQLSAHSATVESPEQDQQAPELGDLHLEAGPNEDIKGGHRDEESRVAFDARQDRWMSILSTLKETALQAEERRKVLPEGPTKNSAPKSTHRKSDLRSGIVVKEGFVAPSEVSSPREIEEYRQISGFEFPSSCPDSYEQYPKTTWLDSLDVLYHASCMKPNHQSSLSAFLSTYSESTPRSEAIALCASLFYPEKGSLLLGENPMEIWRFFEIVSSHFPNALNGLSGEHWENIIRHTIFAFAPTNIGSAPLPEHIRSVLPLSVTRIIGEMKKRRIPFTSVTFSAMYRANVADPRKAVAAHEYARASQQKIANSSTESIRKTSLISDESIRTLLGILLYGGSLDNTWCSRGMIPGYVVKRDGPILSFLKIHAHRTAEDSQRSQGGALKLVDLASVAENLWNDSESFGIQLSRQTLVAFIQAFGTFKDKSMVETAHRRLMMLPKQSKDVASNVLQQEEYRALIAAHRNCGNLKAVVRLYESSNGIIGSADDLEPVFTSMSELGLQSDILKSFAAAYKKQPFPLTNNIIEQILQALVSLTKGDSGVSISKKQAKVHFRNVLSFLDSTMAKGKEERVERVSTRSHISLLYACVEIGDLQFALDVYWRMKAARSSSAQTEYESASSEIVATDTSPTADSRAHEFTDFTPRPCVAQILHLWCSQSVSGPEQLRANLKAAAHFFETELLTEERVGVHWRKIENGWRRAQNARSHHAPVSQAPPHDAVEKDRRLGGPPIRVGQDGVFQICYDKLDAGFRSGLEKRITADGGDVGIGSGIDRGPDLLMLSETLEYLRTREKEIICKVLNK